MIATRSLRFLRRRRRHYLAEDRIKLYMYQLVKAMDHMHRNGIFHRDIKPENILIMDDCLKLADFGSCRGIYSKQPYTEYISTRWRARRRRPSRSPAGRPATALAHTMDPPPRRR